LAGVGGKLIIDPVHHASLAKNVGVEVWVHLAIF
jgi:hypothetical protein